MASDKDEVAGAEIPRLDADEVERIAATEIDHRVGAGAGQEHVVRSRGQDDHGISGDVEILDHVEAVPDPEPELISARATDQRVIAGTTTQNVIAAIAGQPVVLRITEQRVVKGAA